MLNVTCRQSPMHTYKTANVYLVEHLDNFSKFFSRLSNKSRPLLSTKLHIFSLFLNDCYCMQIHNAYTIMYRRYIISLIHEMYNPLSARILMTQLIVVSV